jgi:tetratricopeptide (TPR) repeat protein
MLQPLERDALIITNGDNDTFPLWYIQEVEGVRKDVRVVNLSLLNTGWYMQQLRDYDPKVDIGWNDRQIEAVRVVPEVFFDYARGVIGKEDYQAYLKEFDLQRYVPTLDDLTYARDVATRRIIEREYGKRPIYFAVTVPDQMGFTPRLAMEGLAFRLGEPHGSEVEAVDVEKTLHNLREVYQYRGLLGPDRKRDPNVYKDENAQRLVQNYAAGFVRSAEGLLDQGRVDEALATAKEALEFTESPQIIYSCGVIAYRADRFGEAEALFRKLVDIGYGDFQILRVLGRSLERQNRLAEAETVYQDAYRQYPDDQEALREIFSFYMENGRTPDAYGVLESWVRRHPADEAAKRRLSELGDSLPSAR